MVRMNTQIQLKLYKEEKARLKELARSKGLGVSPFVRSLIFKELKAEASA